MSYKEDINYVEWKEEKACKQETLGSAEKKASAPRFLEKWLVIFDPWVTQSKDDPNRPFCKACQTSLDCNRAHLQRHERTSKHERNLKIFLENGEQAALENFHLRQERNKYYFQRKMKQLDKDDINETAEFGSSADGDYSEGRDIEEETAVECVRTNITRYNSDQYSRKPSVKQVTYNPKTHTQICNTTKPINKRTPPAAVSRKDRIQLFMQIQKDKNDLMKTFRDLIRTNNNATEPKPPPPHEKNHVDLFFESVSSTVKTLSPKLIAEAKMRVQQLICELELRELTESSTTTTGGNATPGGILVSQSSGNSFVLQTNEKPDQSCDAL